MTPDAAKINQKGRMMVIKEEYYKNLPLLRSKKNYSFDTEVLDRIIDIFDYADAIKGFSPVFMRFDFPENTSLDSVKRFLKYAKDDHTSKDRLFLYMYTKEFEPEEKYTHYHAFCVVNHREYSSAKAIENMLTYLWRHEQKKRKDDKSLHFTRRDPTKRWNKTMDQNQFKRFNFYSLSTDVQAESGDRELAFTAASYLAKTSQLPEKVPGQKKRHWNSSALKKLSPEEIRPGYDPQKAERFLKAPPTS